MGKVGIQTVAIAFLTLFLAMVCFSADVLTAELDINLTTLEGEAVDYPGLPVKLRLYSAAVGGNLLWKEEQFLDVVQGRLRLVPGAGVTTFGTAEPEMFRTPGIWLELEIDHDVLSPRREVSHIDTFSELEGEVYAAVSLADMNAAALVLGSTINTGAPLDMGTNAITLGGVTRSTWPSGSGGETPLWEEIGGNIFRSSGNVGIGTPAPAYPLHILGNTFVGTDAKGIRLHTDGLFADLESKGTALSINWFGPNTLINTTEGNVGIGNFLPLVKLDVIGAIRSTGTGSTPSIRLLHTDAQEWRITSYTDGLRFWNGTDRMIIDSNGKVGVGTMTPEQKLHVNGIAKFNLGNGSISLSTPGGWPGFIAYSPNGHRRDFQFYDNALQINMSTNASAPAAGQGIILSEDNNVGIGTFPSRKLHVKGWIECDVIKINGGADLSEQFDVHGIKEEIAPEPGMVVSIDPTRPGKLIVSSEPYDHKVAGVISGAGNVHPGMLMGQTDSLADGESPVALTGRVYCLADASKGSIAPGDLMTTSGTPGHAMKVSDYGRAQGAVLGKAMTNLDRGSGLVLVLVTLQ